MDDSRKFTLDLSKPQFTYVVSHTGVFSKIYAWGEPDEEKNKGYVSTSVLQAAVTSNFHNDLAEFVPENLKGIVLSIPAPRIVSAKQGSFRIEWTVYTSTKLSKEEGQRLISYIETQCSDEWGQSFEQIAVDKGEETRKEVCEECQCAGKTTAGTCTECQGKGFFLYPVKYDVLAHFWDSKIFNKSIKLERREKSEKSISRGKVFRAFLIRLKGFIFFQK